MKENRREEWRHISVKSDSANCYDDNELKTTSVLMPNNELKPTSVLMPNNELKTSQLSTDNNNHNNNNNQKIKNNNNNNQNQKNKNCKKIGFTTIKNNGQADNYILSCFWIALRQALIVSMNNNNNKNCAIPSVTEIRRQCGFPNASIEFDTNYYHVCAQNFADLYNITIDVYYINTYDNGKSYWIGNSNYSFVPQNNNEPSKGNFSVAALKRHFELIISKTSTSNAIDLKNIPELRSSRTEEYKYVNNYNSYNSYDNNDIIVDVDDSKLQSNSPYSSFSSLKIQIEISNKDQDQIDSNYRAVSNLNDYPYANKYHAVSNLNNYPYANNYRAVSNPNNPKLESLQTNWNFGITTTQKLSYADLESTKIRGYINHFQDYINECSQKLKNYQIEINTIDQADIPELLKSIKREEMYANIENVTNKLAQAKDSVVALEKQLEH